LDLATFILGLLLSVFAAVIPTAIWASLVWWCDRYEREPIPLLVVSFVWGALPAVLLALLLETLLDVPGGGLGQGLVREVVSASAVAPIVEELAKGGALLLILLFWRGELDDVLDGILYGAMIGFGFAMTENLLYFMSALSDGGWGEWGTVVFLRGVVFGLNHAFFTAFSGAGLGYARLARGRGGRYGAPLLGLGAAILAHAVHNLGTPLSGVQTAAILLSLVGDAGGVLLVAVMIGLALRQEQRWLRTELTDEIGRLLTAPEYEMLSSLRGRWRMLRQARRAGGWQAVRAVSQLQQAATELVFSKQRTRTRGPDPQLARRQDGFESRLAAVRRVFENPAGLRKETQC